MNMRAIRNLTAILALSALFPLGNALAEGALGPGDGPLVIKDYLLLESPRVERGHLDLSAGTPGVRRYSGGFLPSDLPSSPKMYTFKATFGVDPALKGVDLALYMGLAEYPYRIYLNGLMIFSKGRYSSGHYNSSLRAVNSIFLSPDILRYGSPANDLVLEAYPLYENWGLDRVYVDRRASVERAVFLRNFMGINLHPRRLRARVHHRDLFRCPLSHRAARQRQVHRLQPHLRLLLPLLFQRDRSFRFERRDSPRSPVQGRPRPHVFLHAGVLLRVHLRAQPTADIPPRVARTGSPCRLPGDDQRLEGNPALLLRLRHELSHRPAAHRRYRDTLLCPRQEREPLRPAIAGFLRRGHRRRGPRRGLPRQGRPPLRLAHRLRLPRRRRRDLRDPRQGAGRPLPQVDPANRRPRRRSEPHRKPEPGTYPAEGLLLPLRPDAVPRAPREGLGGGHTPGRQLAALPEHPLLGHAQLHRPLGGHASGGEFRVPQQLPVPHGRRHPAERGLRGQVHRGCHHGPVRLERRPDRTGDDALRRRGPRRRPRDASRAR